LNRSTTLSFARSTWERNAATLRVAGAEPLFGKRAFGKRAFDKRAFGKRAFDKRGALFERREASGVSVMQILLLLVGHVYSLRAAQRVSINIFGDRKAAFRSQLPMLVGMIYFSVFSLWLLKQPMEMRTSAM
jgi:hypothetical protein